MVRSNRLNTDPPSSEEAQAARDALRRLGYDAASPTSVRLSGGGSGSEPIELPSAIAAVICRALDAIARGQAVAVLPMDALLTTQQAADVLGVSRPHLIGLMESGKLPFEMAGTHRRVRLNDLLGYRARVREERAMALDALADESQRLLGDDY